MDEFNLKNKVALVTGAASGIGRAIAFKFAEYGALVQLMDFNDFAGEQTAKEIEKKGGKAVFHKCDVTSQQDVINVVVSINSKTPINILVNNAGIAHVGNLENTSEEDFDRLYNVNIKGIYNCMLACIPFMKEIGGGVILNMASIAGSKAVADRFAYSMTKGAVLSMTYSVAQDYIKDNIRCNSISPARIHTPFVDNFIEKNYPGDEKQIFETLAKSQPIGRMGKPEEVASLALFLCSDQASFITGMDYPLDGGFINLKG
jgi:NAD(P)-dependent dehydrogenase (short-subunit alcohol dehydrogenase family)